MEAISLIISENNAESQKLIQSTALNSEEEYKECRPKNILVSIIKDSAPKIDNLMMPKSDTFFYLGNEHKRKIETRDRAIFNLRGIKYEVLLNLFEILPHSRLYRIKRFYDSNINRLIENSNILESNLLDLCDGYNSNQNEFYFNKDPYVFNIILNYISYQKLHIDDNICIYLILDEFKYWNLDISSMKIDQCCKVKWTEKLDSIVHANEMLNITSDDASKRELNKIELYDRCITESFRVKLWNLMNEPRSSFLARVNFNVTNI